MDQHPNREEYRRTHSSLNLKRNRTLALDLTGLKTGNVLARVLQFGYQNQLQF